MNSWLEVFGKLLLKLQTYVLVMTENLAFLQKLQRSNLEVKEIGGALNHLLEEFT